MGEVYVGKDLETNERVALKLLHKPLCAVEEQVARFEREFRLTSQIDHPNVVRMLAFGKQSGGPLDERHYLVMEFLEGRGLDQVLEGGPLPLPTVVHIGRQVASALSAVHAQGVVHRDLKPGNIQVLHRGATPEVKVMDFGLGRLQGGDGGEELTDVGVRLGTAEYMSPEYIAHHQLDSRSDLYALGCVLFQLLTGRTPYEGRTMRIMQDHVTAPVPRPSDYADRAPDWFDDLVMKLMEKEPEDRPDGAEAVARILADHAETPTPKRRERPASRNSVAPSVAPQGLSSMSHLGGEDALPVYPDPKPAVPTTPVAVSIGLLLAAVAGMAVLGFIVGIVILSVL
jgi:serine/threonine-protein kinase